MGIKILIADDEFHIRRFIADYLKKEEYEVLEAKDGEEALDMFYATKDLDLIILDVMMPKYTGLQVCQEIRKESEIPVMMLTALNEEENELKGLGVGANDYVSKPLSYKIFLARVKVLLRKALKEEHEKVDIGTITINQSNRTVYIKNELVRLTPKEYDLLIYLVNNKGRALSRDQILTRVWGYDFFGGVRTVDTHIKSLRAAFKEEGKRIRTVRGIGYELQVLND